MWFAMDRSELTFVDDPKALRIDASSICPAPPARVFEVLGDPSTWPRWFDDMRTAAWTSSETARIGAVRRVSLGLGTFEERMIAWEPGTRFSFSIDGASVPLARRIVEDWRLSPIDGGKTKLEWSMVVAPTLLSRVLRPALEPMMKRMFRKSSEGLERYLLA